MEKLTKVGSITLEVGEVSGIVPGYLSDFWLYARRKSALLKETELKIENIEAVTYCQSISLTIKGVPFLRMSFKIFPGIPNPL